MSDDYIEGFERLFAEYQPKYYRLDGSLYPPGLEGLLAWGRDLEDTRGRMIAQDCLWNGLWLSTVWLGLDHRYGKGPPLIFETMAFNRITDDHGDTWCERWSTLDDAQVGHLYLKHYLGSLRFTLKLWLELIWAEVRGDEEGIQ